METNAGIALMEDALLGVGGLTLLTNGNARLGVGDGNGSVPTPAVGDTNLAAATNKWFQAMAPGYPSRSGTTITFQAVFGTATANFAWNEWCCDPLTEILTAQGWRTYDKLGDGIDVLGLDLETLTSRWEPLVGVAVWPERKRVLRCLEMPGHSSLTTLDHRWPVMQRVDHGKGGRYPELRWRTTAELSSESGILRCAPHADSPVVPKYDDALVELIGWFWTEGWRVKRGGSRRSVIGQSLAKNPANVARIRFALADQFPGGWSETVRPDGMVYFQLQVAPSAILDGLTGADKQPHPWVLRALTQAQLRLLLDTAMAGDGSTSRQSHWNQVASDGIAAFEMTAALAGIATRTYQAADDPSSRYGANPSRVELLRRQTAKPLDTARQASRARLVAPGIERRCEATDTLVEHEGIVWCPQTPSTAWLARRNGTVYFTGNCIDNGGAGAGTSGATVGGVMFNHKGVALGTKASGSTWTLTTTVTQS